MTLIYISPSQRNFLFALLNFNYLSYLIGFIFAFDLAIKNLIRSNIDRDLYIIILQKFIKVYNNCDYPLIMLYMILGFFKIKEEHQFHIKLERIFQVIILD